MEVIHKFSDSVQHGDAGEALFLEANPEYRKGRYDSYTDFQSDLNGTTVELKTDTYSMERTPNFFIERYSSDQTMLPGGPYRNLNTTYWVYYFLEQDTAFWFHPRDLVERIHELGLDDENTLVPIRNRGYNTLGWKIPRSAVEDLAVVTHFREESTLP